MFVDKIEHWLRNVTRHAIPIGIVFVAAHEISHGPDMETTLECCRRSLCADLEVTGVRSVAVCFPVHGATNTGFGVG